MENNTLGVMSIFRNESGSLEEFILHHLDQGVDHFYLINNASDDDFQEIIDKYYEFITMIEQPIVSNLGDKFDGTTGIQDNCYRMMLPYVKTEWLMVIDLDEFIYTRSDYYNIKEFLTKEGHRFDQIIIKLKQFNSNNHIKQPDSIIDGFTSRVDHDYFHGFNPKVIARTNKIKEVSPHTCKLDINTTTIDDCLNRTTDAFEQRINKMKIRNEFTFCKEKGLIEPYIIGNHYPVQSEEWFYNVKAKRGICGWAATDSDDIPGYFEEYYTKYNNRVRKDDFELKELSKRWKKLL